MCDNLAHHTGLFFILVWQLLYCFLLLGNNFSLHLSYLETIKSYSLFLQKIQIFFGRTFVNNFNFLLTLQMIFRNIMKPIDQFLQQYIDNFVINSKRRSLLRKKTEFGNYKIAHFYLVQIRTPLPVSNDTFRHSFKTFAVKKFLLKIVKIHFVKIKTKLLIKFQ